MPRHHYIFTSIIIILCCLLFTCCNKKKEEEEFSGPVVAPMELAVTVRSDSPPPQNAHKIEISNIQFNVNGKKLFDLDKGRISKSDYHGTSVPDLESALQSQSRSNLAVEVYSGVPYETLFALLSTAHKIGIRNVSFKVRKTPNSSETGWLAINNYQITENAWDEMKFNNVVSRPWTDFVEVWDQAADACFTQKFHVACMSKPAKVSQLGRLQISMSAIDRGMTLSFRQVGVEIPQDEEEAALAELSPEEQIAAKAKKEEEEEGPVKWADGEEFPHPDGLDDELTKEFMKLPPARYAGFQFRGSEAVNLPSPVTDTMKPVCGNVTCGVLIEGRKSTAAFRMLTLLAATFPEGTPPPSVAFVRPVK